MGFYDPTNPNNPVDSPVLTDATPLSVGETDPGFSQTGPLLDVQRLKDEYLFGIPLRAALTNQVISDETLKRFIEKAVSDFETSVRIPVRPTRIFQKFDYKRADDIAFGCRQLKRWPLLKVEIFQALFPGRIEGQEDNYPTNWVETDGDQGLIRIIPKGNTGTPTAVNFIGSPGFAGLPLIGTFQDWPNLWRITYIAGFDYDQIPHAVNDLIGTIAAIKLLSQLGPSIFPYNSQSIGIDGMSQGTGSPGPQWLSRRIEELEQERDRMVASLRAHFGTDIILSAW